MHLDREQLPHPVSEYPFAPENKKWPWKIDFAWWFCSLHSMEEVKLAVEIEGGIYENDKGGSGHRSIRGFVRGIFKYNKMTEHHWYLLRFLPEQIEQRSTIAIESISAFLRPHWPKDE